jgi:outer membrane protein OmpA-like peptidoglycan-associated protein
MRRYLIYFAVMALFGTPLFSQEAAGKGGLRMIADLYASPAFTEPTYNMLAMSLNGSLFLGGGSEGFAMGGEIWDHYLTFTAPDDPYNYNGAWNILRGTVTVHAAPLEWLRLKFGLGGAWYRSAFSSNDAGVVGREGPGLSAVADVGVVVIPDVLRLTLLNKFDLVFLEAETMPVYSVALNATVYPGLDWMAFFVEAGLQTFIQAGLPREHDTAMFVWNAGVKFDLSFSPAPQTEPPLIITEKKLTTGPLPARDEKKEREKQIQNLKTGKIGNVVAFDTIIFLPNAPDIKTESYLVLDQIARILHERKTISVEIRGHTNDLGDAKDEFDLSLKRAEAVRAYLISKGIAVRRMKCAGLGSEFSKNLAVTEANRKVEFRILSE